MGIIYTPAKLRMNTWHPPKADLLQSSIGHVFGQARPVLPVQYCFQLSKRFGLQALVPLMFFTFITFGILFPSGSIINYNNMYRVVNEEGVGVGEGWITFTLKKLTISHICKRLTIPPKVENTLVYFYAFKISPLTAYY